MRMQGLMIANCLLALACSAPGAANDAMRCETALNCLDQQVCYRGFCVESDGPLADAGMASSGTLAPVASPSPHSAVAPSGASPAVGASPSAAGGSPSVAGGSPSAAGGSPSASPSDAQSGSSGAQPSGAPGNTSGSAQATIAIVDGGAAANAPAVHGGAAASAPDVDASVVGASPVGGPAATATSVGAVASNTPPAQMPVKTGERVAPTSASPAQPMPEDAGERPVAQACLAACAVSSNGKACRECFQGLYGDSPHKLCGAKGAVSMSAECAAFCAVAPQGPFGCADSHACKGEACGGD